MAKVEKDNWLEERIKTCRNLCDISLLLIREKRADLLPTVLEFLFELAQRNIDKNCVKKD
jgi:hypothetical protein